MSKPTPGPWEVDRCWNDDDYTDIIGADGSTRIARVCSDAEDSSRDHEAEANARLIASAPALRDALRHVAAVLDAHGWGIVDERQVRAALAACEERDP